MSHSSATLSRLGEINRPSVIMMVGIPGSGKSYIAEQLGDILDVPVLSSDVIRKEICGNASNQKVSGAMWQTLYGKAEQIINSQQSVIIDATHAIAEYRQADINRYRSMGAQAIVGVHILTAISVACTRNTQRERHVPEHVIHRMHNNILHTPPSTSDGFDFVVPVRND